MGLISSPTHVFCRRPPLIAPPSTTKSHCSYNPRLNLKSIPKAQQPQRARVVGGSLSSLSNQALLQLGFPPNRKRLLPVVSCSPETARPIEEPKEDPRKGPKEKPKEEDHRAVEAVQKLYTAIKNKDVKEVSDLLGDESRRYGNFIPALQRFHGKKQVLEFFGHVMRILGKAASLNFEFKMHDGMNVGVSWKLEWRSKPVPVGTGFSFLVLQEYRAKVMIKNVGAIMDRLIHLGPLRMKIAAVMMLILNKFRPFPLLDSKKRKYVYVFLTLIVTFAILLLLFKASH